MSGEEPLGLGRLARLLTLIMFVTATFLLVAADRLDGDLFPVAAVAIGSIAFITAITSFLVAAGQFYEETSIDRAQ
jgi:hypothetical protein